MTGTQSSQSAASAVRAVADHGKSAAPTAAPISASPASLEFTAAQAAAGTPQTVKVTAQSDRKLSVSIAGTGNCPTVSPSKLQPKHAGDDGDHRGWDHDGDKGHHDGDDHHDGDHHGDGDADGHAGVITVTPNGAGPASCAITVSAGDGNNDRDDKNAPSVTIPVTVDAPATPAPTPTPSATPTPVPTPTPSPTPLGR